MDTYLGTLQIAHREMPSTTPQRLPMLAFYHPAMQEALLNAAEQAGAEIRRGARAVDATVGKEPTVRVETEGRDSEELSARLVVGVDGRGSLARKWGGFTEQRDADRLRISGLMFENSAAPDDTLRSTNDLGRGRAALIIPLGGSRVRAYFICGVGEGLRLQGEKDVNSFIEASVGCGMPAEYFEGAQAAGPLATFDGADRWVEHPFRDGIALIGDAAASSDPSWGQGLALTLRDARVLRDALSSNDDWDAAGHAYASEHDRYYGTLHKVEDWLTQFLYVTGPEADARRAKAFPLIAQDRTRMPDALFTGPDSPVDDETRRRLFGES